MDFPVGKRISIKTGEVLPGTLFTEEDKIEARGRALANVPYGSMREDLLLWEDLGNGARKKTILRGCE